MAMTKGVMVRAALTGVAMEADFDSAFSKQSKPSDA